MKRASRSLAKSGSESALVVSLFPGCVFLRLLSSFGLPLGANGRPKRAFWVPKGVQKVTKIVLFAKPGKVDLEW